MKEEQKQTIVTIDAAGKRLGRVASEAAKVLMGKHTPHFERHRDANPAQVRIENTRKLLMSDKKRLMETYDRYSGYPGGRKVETRGHLIDRKGYPEIMRLAVFGMLPRNKLRPLRMKRLSIGA